MWAQKKAIGVSKGGEMDGDYAGEIPNLKTVEFGRGFYK